MLYKLGIKKKGLIIPFSTIVCIYYVPLYTRVNTERARQAFTIQVDAAAAVNSPVGDLCPLDDVLFGTV